MNEEMKFPKTFEEFIKQYSFFDKQQIYTNGSELIQVFRIKQWEEHKEKENQELKKQVEEYQQELEKADSITQSCIFNGKEGSKISYRKCLNMLDKKETQQKEFIEYMTKTIEELECEDVDDEEMKGYLIQRIDTFKEILQKYKSIIGV